MPLDRDACERRAYRLAVLLVGDEGGALAVMRSVLRAKPDLRAIDGAHLDRLTILACRERVAAPLATLDVPPPFAARLAALPDQQREAWILARVYGTPPREVARAMDCSVTASSRHLELAEQALAGVDAAIPARLAGSAATIDLPRMFRIVRRRRRRTRLLVLALAAIVAALGALAGLAWLAGRLAAATVLSW